MGALYELSEHRPGGAPTRRVDEARRRDAVERAAAEWLETQARVIGFWRDLVVSADGDRALVAALDAHAGFLEDAARHALR
ncbi:MAG: hypothetical protein MI723_12720 [Caulobacterales bacterium]|nr:hypothetical protein [Caulobacterales bacterium]